MERFCLAPTDQRLQICNPKRMNTQMEFATEKSDIAPALLNALSDHLEVYLTHYSTWVPAPQKKERRKLIAIARQLVADNGNKPEAIDSYANSIPLSTPYQRPTPYALVVAIEKAGGILALSKQLRVTQQSIFKWQSSGVPMKHWEVLMNYLTSTNH